MMDRATVQPIVFEDEITIWWTKDLFVGADHYRLYLNGDFFDEEEGAIENVQIKRVSVLPSSLGEHLPNYFNNVKNLIIED